MNPLDDLEFVERQLARHTDPYDTVRLMWEQRRDALREEIANTESDLDLLTWDLEPCP